MRLTGTGAPTARQTKEKRRANLGGHTAIARLKIHPKIARLARHKAKMRLHLTVAKRPYPAPRTN